MEITIDHEYLGIPKDFNFYSLTLEALPERQIISYNFSQYINDEHYESYYVMEMEHFILIERDDLSHVWGLHFIDDPEFTNVCIRAYKMKTENNSIDDHCLGCYMFHREDEHKAELVTRSSNNCPFQKTISNDYTVSVNLEYYWDQWHSRVGSVSILFSIAIILFYLVPICGLAFVLVRVVRSNLEENEFQESVKELIPDTKVLKTVSSSGFRWKDDEFEEIIPDKNPWDSDYGDDNNYDNLITTSTM